MALLTLFLCGLSGCAEADVARLMEQYLWEKRVLILFTPSAENSYYKQQNRLLSMGAEGLNERDIVIWRLVSDSSVSVGGRSKAQLGTPPFYDYFDAQRAEFTVILLGKDGEEKLRQKEPVSADALFGLIDAMPMRQKEMQKK